MGVLGTPRAPNEAVAIGDGRAARGHTPRPHSFGGSAEALSISGCHQKPSKGTRVNPYQGFTHGNEAPTFTVGYNRISVRSSRASKGRRQQHNTLFDPKLPHSDVLDVWVTPLALLSLEHDAISSSRGRNPT